LDCWTLGDTDIGGWHQRVRIRAGRGIEGVHGEERSGPGVHV